MAWNDLFLDHHAVTIAGPYKKRVRLPRKPSSEKIKKQYHDCKRREPAIYVNPKYTERDLWELTKGRWKAFKDSASGEDRES
jgi:hypothetical protein